VLIVVYVSTRLYVVLLNGLPQRRMSSNICSRCCDAVFIFQCCRGLSNSIYRISWPRCAGTMSGGAVYLPWSPGGCNPPVRAVNPGVLAPAAIWNETCCSPAAAVGCSAVRVVAGIRRYLMDFLVFCNDHHGRSFDVCCCVHSSACWKLPMTFQTSVP